MTNNSPDYKRLYEEEQRRREEEQRRREEAEQRQQDERRRREEADKARQEADKAKQEADKAKQEAEKKIHPTTLPHFLHACHVDLQAGLAVQSEELSTKGDPSNAREKKRPTYMREWSDFPSRQIAIWNELVCSSLMTEGHFTSPHTMSEYGKSIRRRMMGSELDIHHFQRSTVEENVSMIIECIYKDEELRHKFGLKGSVQFENHANTLSPDDALSERVQSVDITNRGRRRSPRLEMKRRDQESNQSKSPGLRPSVTSRPRADQFCVYNISTDPEKDERVPAFIIEYKAPHKFFLKAIRRGLGELALQDVLEYGDDDTPLKKYQRLVAAAVTQAFSYMVKAGLEFGYVCTGEAFIFLQVPEDPTTVRYFLSTPQADVGDSTGWSEDAAASSTNNRLHLTAVAQVLAFTLQALQCPPRSHEWRANAEKKLATWEYVYSEVLDAAPPPEATPSEYWPSPDNELMRVSPIALRHGAVPRRRVACRPTSNVAIKEDDPDADDDTPDTPSQPARDRARRSARSHGDSGQTSKATQPTSKGRGSQQARLFCTRRCLLGLVRGGHLDRECPNVNEHGTTIHRINKDLFLAMMRDQLSRTLDSDFEPCGRPGSRGVPFRATLASHGYTVLAKCTPADFVDCLQNEADAYERMSTIQAHHVPANLGSLDLTRPYYYEGIAKLVHVMFLEHAGDPISRHWKHLDQKHALRQIEQCMKAIHRLGVLHRDVMPRNILWNPRSNEVTFIDFERAKLTPNRPVLGPLSTNRKRKQKKAAGCQRRVDHIERAFAQELANAKHAISCL